MSASTRELLDDRLRALTSACGASCAFVIDTSGEVFGATGLPDDWQELVTAVTPLVIEATREHPLRRGGHLHLMRSVEPPFAAAESFAGVYMLLALFGGPFAAADVTAAVRAALPEIEALTLTQPPPDPTRQAGAQRMRSA